MNNTSTKPFISLLLKVTKLGTLGKNIALRQRSALVLMTFAFICSSPYVRAQATLPALSRVEKPSPEPAAPGDSFTPTKSGTAVTTAPQAAEWTRTAGPDESVVLTGVNLSRYTGNDEGKDSRFLVAGRNGVQKEALIQRIEADKAIITLPKDIPAWSMYLIWPGNEAGYGAPMAVNKTEAWWVGPDKATRGQTVSVFGRNLAQNNDTLRSYVYIKPANSAGQWATVTRVNPYKVDFTIPTGLGNGEYEIWTHNGHGGQYGWSGPQKLTVYNGPQWTTTFFNVKNYGAMGNGATDDTEAIRRAMLAAKNSPGSTVYFPTGVYMLNSNLTAYSNIQLKGDGRDKTILRCAATYSTGAMGMIFGTVQNFAMSDLAFDGNKNFRDSLGKPIFLRGSSDVWITNVRFSFAGYHVMDLHQTRYLFLSKTEHIGIDSFLGDGSQLFIDRNSFKLTNDTDMALHTWSGAGISMTRSTCTDLDNSNLYDGAGWGKGRFFTGNGTWGSNRNTYLGENITTDLTPRPFATDQNTGEQFMWEGNLGQWAGFAGSATATTTSLSGYATNNPNKQYAVIVKGRGIGQSRRIVANNGGTVTLNEPWNVIPDGSSYIVVGNFIDRIAVYGNYLDGKPRAVTSPDHIAAAGIEPYGGAFNFIASNNTLHELRQGIANWSTQHYTGLDPNFFSIYTNNKMINCRWGLYNQLILARPEGTAILGTTYRNNHVQAAAVAGIHTNISSSGLNSLDSDVYEFNTISNSPQGSTSSLNGLTNQLFYKNTFNSVGGAGITITPKMALRENTYQGVSTLYKGGLQGTTIEAPLHVLDITGIAGGNLVTTDFTLKNSTIAPMSWVATSSASWLTLTTGSGTIPDERCVSLVSLQANPAGLPVGTHAATITVTVADQVKKYMVLLKLSAAQNGINITAPAASQTFAANEQINITVSATDNNAGITKVEFFSGATKLGEDLTSPYAYNWTNAPAGTFALNAKATNSAGVTVTSAPVNVTVTGNAAPTVAITSPTNAATFAAPASVSFTANATDTDGTITKVEFFNGTTKIGEDLSAPYTFTWYNIAVGSYAITAKATDNLGSTTTSSPVLVSALKASAPTVNLIAPGDNNTIYAPTNVHLQANAELTDGAINRVEFFSGTTKIGERINPPFEMHFMNIPTGNYTFTARATGSNGTTTTSAPVRVSVVSSGTAGNTAPTVSLSSPLTNTNFTAPASLTITANAADANGSVSKVEFFIGTIKLGEDLTSPYSLTLTNVLADTYTLTAKATDNGGATTTSAPVNIKVTTANVLNNQAPNVTLTSPLASTGFTAPAMVYMSAHATDSDGIIAKVEFFNGSVKLGEDVTSPYTFTWNNVTAGPYALTARATDNSGAAAMSTTINIGVNAPTVISIAPTVAITSPASSSMFMSPATIIFTANAADTDGTITKVEFFNGTIKLGEDLTAPYTFTWANVATGNYSITARAVDNAGLTATSTAVNINVNTPMALTAPTVQITSPVTGTAFTAPANLTITANAADADGSVSKVEFFNGNTLLGTATSSPYSFTWNNVAAGNYIIMAKATDNSDLTTTSTAVQISVATPHAPTVAITSPTQNASFTSPVNVNITATAADADGSVTKVEFFNGFVKLGEDLTSPYSFDWNSAPVGAYILTARATDNTGLTTTSTGIKVTVNAPAAAPTVAITAPLTGSTLTAPANLIVTANAAATDGMVTKVEFYNGNIKLGEDLTSPYTLSWNSVPAGAYTLTAKATNNNGLTTTSAVVVVNIITPNAPSVDITSPTHTAIFAAPINLTLTASAADSDGKVIKVEFFQGTVKLGEDLTSPYSFAWNNVPAGAYTLTAKATDNSGLTTTSAAVSITLKAPSAPTVAITAPVSGSNFISPAAIAITASAADTDGSVIKVEFYQGTVKLGEDLTSPYTFNWNNVTAGSYLLTAKAYDNTGLTTTSAAVNLVVKSPAAPTVAITAPLTGSSLNAPANLTITANATDTDGVVTKVEFYNGNVKLGEDLTSPYSFSWNSVPAGAYTLTAKATDNNGLATTSAAVNIQVKTSPTGTPVPDISITSPVAGTNLNGTLGILINTKILNAVGTIQKVEFYANNIKIGEESKLPFSFTWNNATNGTYALTAKAINKDGETRTSLPVEITVVNPENPLTPGLSTIIELTASPNPAQNRSTIAFVLTADEEYQLDIYDLKGILIKTLATGKARANETVKVNWAAANLPKGIYTFVLTTSSSIKTTRIVLQ